MEQNLSCRKSSVPTALFKQSPVSSTKPTPPSCWAGLGKDSLAGPAQQEQPLQGSRSGVTLPARSGQVPAPFPCTVWLKAALWIPGDAHLLLDIPGGCRQQVPCSSCPPLCRDSPTLAGVSSAWSPSDALPSSFPWLSRLRDLSEHRLTTSPEVFLEMPLCRQQRSGTEERGWPPAAPPASSQQVEGGLETSVTIAAKTSALPGQHRPARGQ